MILAGIPTTTAPSGTSCVTTAFAPIITLFSTWTPPIIFEPAQITTLFPILGIPLVPRPIVTPWKMSTFFPILHPSLITMQEKC